MPHVYGTYPEDVWRARYDQINDFERELAASGCAILKIFLVVSQEEQKKTLPRETGRSHQVLEIRHLRSRGPRPLG